MWSLPSRKLPFILIISSLIVLTTLLLNLQTRPSPQSLFNTLLEFQIQHPTYITNITPSTRNTTTDPVAIFNKASLPTYNPHLLPLLTCRHSPDITTSHIRLPNIHYNISLTPPSLHNQRDQNRRYFNPTLIPLPSWSPPSKGKYILVSRVVTPGLHQESVACYADFCLPDPRFHNSTQYARVPPDAKPCDESLHTPLLGVRGGLYCVTEPNKLNVPPTPALQCDGPWTAFPDIPGFHDPRIFWSGKGEPLIIVNSASQYGCVGLWVVDLRTLIPGLGQLMVGGNSVDEAGEEQGRLRRDIRHGKAWESLMGPIMSYPHLTELTRNPRYSRNNVEKNWMMWFPTERDAVVGFDLLGHSIRQDPQDDVRGQNHREQVSKSKNGSIIPRSHSFEKPVSGGRTFAQLIGNGYTTRNLTSSIEQSCFDDSHHHDTLGRQGHWHQGSNSLRLILCTRAQARQGKCPGLHKDGGVQDGVSVHFAVMHRKFSNEMDLPLRYERFFVVWESRKPYRVVAVSKSPVLMWDEKANGWGNDRIENKEGWNRTVKIRKRTDKEMGEGSSPAYFTYTPSLTWAWRPKIANTGIYDQNERENDFDDEDENIKHLSRLGAGFLGDEVLIGIGMDDVDQAVARVKVEDLLQCLRLCPGANTETKR